MKQRQKLRRAGTHDVCAITRIDPLARSEPSRRRLIRESVDDGNCHLTLIGRRIVAYAVLDYSFYGNGFLAVLYVDPEHRRGGLGSALLRLIEAKCRTPKLFTSTNRSNTGMRALLAKLGYTPSGVIHNLDEGDPELVYFKRLRPSMRKKVTSG